MLMQWGQFVDHDLTGVSSGDLANSLFTRALFSPQERPCNYICCIRSDRTEQGIQRHGAAVLLAGRCWLPTAGVYGNERNARHNCPSNHDGVSHSIFKRTISLRPVDRRALNLPCFDVSDALNRGFTKRATADLLFYSRKSSRFDLRPLRAGRQEGRRRGIVLGV